MEWEPMEQITLKVNLGLYSVEEIILAEDKENKYVLFVTINAAGQNDWSVGFTSLDDMDRIYTSVVNNQLKQTVLAHALPLLINALEIKTMQLDASEELVAYKTALQELLKIKL
jgi:hypothetical protein